MKYKQRDFSVGGSNVEYASAAHICSVKVSMSNSVQPGENVSAWIKSTILQFTLFCEYLCSNSVFETRKTPNKSKRLSAVGLLLFKKSHGEM